MPPTNNSQFNLLLATGQLLKVSVGDVCFVHFPTRAAIGARIRQPGILLFILSAEGAILARVRLPQHMTPALDSGLVDIVGRVESLYSSSRAYFAMPGTRIVCAIYGNCSSLAAHVQYVLLALGGYGIEVEMRYLTLTEGDGYGHVAGPRTAFAVNGQLFL